MHNVDIRWGENARFVSCFVDSNLALVPLPISKLSLSYSFRYFDAHIKLKARIVDNGSHPGSNFLLPSENHESLITAVWLHRLQQTYSKANHTKINSSGIYISSNIVSKQSAFFQKSPRKVSKGNWGTHIKTVEIVISDGHGSVGCGVK